MNNLNTTLDTPVNQTPSMDGVPPMIGPRVSKTVLYAALLIAVTAGSGCQSVIQGVMGIPAIPVNRVPPEIMYQNEKDDLIDISLTRLR